MEAVQTSSLGKARTALIMIGCTLTTIAMMGDTAVITAGSEIFQHYAGTNPLVLNFILSGPALIQVFMGPVTGKLLNFISPKTTLLIGFGAFGIGGIFGAMIDNVFYVAAMRAVAGIGMGMVNVSSLTLISDLFDDEARRGTMIGFWNAGMSIIGAAVGIIAGNLVLQGWSAVYAIYWISVPIFLYCLFVIPRLKHSEDRSESESLNGNQLVVKTPWKTVALALASYFVAGALFCIMFYFVSIYVSETAIGDGATSGLLASVISIGTLAGCLVFGPIYKKGKRWVPTMIYAMLVIGYALLFFVHNVAAAAIACFVLGGVNAFNMNHYQTSLSIIAAPKNKSLIIGLAAMILGGSMFLSTYIATLFEMVIEAEMITETFPIIIGISILGLAAAIGVAMHNKNAGQLREA